ncbi:MAG: hypothetical protein ACK5B9_07870 [Flavobacteriia bacterium]|jgi:hypothetical protein
MRFFVYIFCFIFFNLHSQSVLVLGKPIELQPSEKSIQFSYKDNLQDVNLTNYQIVFVFSTGNNFLQKSDEDSLIAYVRKGGNLYLGAENTPFLEESNQILKSIYNFEAYGDFIADTMKIDSNSNFDLSQEKILSGRSTVSFPIDYRLKVEAWSNDNPIILSGKIDQGKIIIDGGYSRFYEAENSKKLLDEILNYFIFKP